MKVIIFLVSYLIGWFFGNFMESSFITYLLFIHVYLILMSRIREDIYKRIVLEPIILSTTSTSIFLLLSGYSFKEVIVMLLTIPFFILINLSKDKGTPKENKDFSDILKEVFIPIVTPISVYLIMTMIIPSEFVVETVFMMVYLLVLFHYQKSIKTWGYTFFFIFFQWLNLNYLFNFFSLLTPFQAVYLLFNLFLFAVISLARNNGRLVLPKIGRGKTSYTRSKSTLKQNIKIQKQSEDM